MLKHQFSDLQLPSDKLVGIYRGVVEDNMDPLEAGRCRVRVFGIHSPNRIQTAQDGIPTAELPWAQPVCGLIEGSISNYGVWSVPVQGSHVFVFFEAGNILQPRYFGTVPGIVSSLTTTTEGFNDPDGVYPDKTGADFDKGLGTYPHNVVFHVHGGHIIEVDSTPDAKRIRVYHSSGTEIIVDNDGNINITGVRNKTKNITGDETINIGGNKDESVSGGDNRRIGGGQTTSIGGNQQITISGNLLLTVHGNCDFDVDGTLNIKGHPINLN
jgi:phage gp45-like